MKLMKQKDINKIRFKSIINENLLYGKFDCHNTPTLTTNTIDLRNKIDDFVANGQQENIVNLFVGCNTIPFFIGDWNLKTNIKEIDKHVINKVVIALPKSTRASQLFEKGCKVKLKQRGFSDQEIDIYYKLAWKKKYVWLDSVIKCIADILKKKMSSEVIGNIMEQEDSRHFCMNLGIPDNPYICTESQFETVLRMALDISLEKENLKFGKCSL